MLFFRKRWRPAPRIDRRPVLRSRTRAGADFTTRLGRGIRVSIISVQYAVGQPAHFPRNRGKLESAPCFEVQRSQGEENRQNIDVLIALFFLLHWNTLRRGYRHLHHMCRQASTHQSQCCYLFQLTFRQVNVLT